MRDELTVIPPAEGLAAPLQPLVERARAFAEGSKAKNTQRAYRADWEDFTTWCSARSPAPSSLPATPATVALYLTDLAQRLKVATLTRRLSSISQAHQLAGHPSPTGDIAVRTVFAGIRRKLGARQTGKAPATADEIRAMLRALEDVENDTQRLRDRAIILVGFACASRRSELVALNVEDLQFRAEGVVVTLERSKTDQEGEGRPIGIPHGRSSDVCPVLALRAWLDRAGIDRGPIFRAVHRGGSVQPDRLCDKAVTLVVKRAARAAGLDHRRFAGHSLRAGLATAAAAAGVDERTIMAQTGHRSVKMVRRYIRDGNVFRQNAAAGLL